MKTLVLSAMAAVVLLALPAPLSAPDADARDFRPLFNGRDLSNWAPVQVAPTRSLRALTP